MPRRKILRDQLYRVARDLGNLEAVEMRPDAFAHERVYRATNQWTRRFPRDFGR